ncbi:MAG TPA: NAD-dependent epimerase/dehydratase family protein [Ktedonobacterales bacterium]
MRCLVTGVGGFVGSHLAERLIADGHDVIGVDAFLDYYHRSLKMANLRAVSTSERFQLIEGDLNELPLDSLLDGCDWVFHQAAQAGVRASWGTSFGVYVRANIDATQRLLEAMVRARHVRRFVYASSSSVYGDAPELPVTEQTLTRPVSPYGVTKLAAEHLCSLYWRNYRIPTVSLRYFTVYGPRQRPDMAFHRFCKAVASGQPITVYGDATQTRDFTYVSDVVEANIQAAEVRGAEGQIFNIAGGSRVALADVIATLEEVAGRSAIIEYEQTARGDVRDTFADTTRAREQLGYAPHVSLRDGLAQEYAYITKLYEQASLSSPASALTLLGDPDTLPTV